MIAIAAQDRSNVGDLYSSTQVYLNEGLTDRLIPKKGVYNDGSAKTYAEQVYSVVANLGYYLRSKVLGDPGLMGGIIPPPPPPLSSPPSSPPPPSTPPTPPPPAAPTGIQRIVVPKPEEISNAVSALKTYLYQIKGYELQHKAIIPFELEITLDGIAGCVQGQVFKINENILPESYSKSDVGFIITGLSHSLQNNDWVTVIKTQICILDADSKPLIKPPISVATLTRIANVNQEAAYVIFAIADYLTELFVAAAKIEQINAPTKFTDVINSIRVGNLKDFNTYLNYWHPKELAAIGSSASAIKFPSSVSKMLNPTGAAADKFDTAWVDTLVFDKQGGYKAVPVGTDIDNPPIKGDVNNVYRNYSFLGRKDPRQVIEIKPGVAAPGAAELTALKDIGKTNLGPLLVNTTIPSVPVMDYVTAAYSTLVEDIKTIVGTQPYTGFSTTPTYNGIIKVDIGYLATMSLGARPTGKNIYYINTPALRSLILSYLQQLMGGNLLLPAYSRPTTFPDLSKIVPISYDPTNTATQDVSIKTVITI
jgi:hypothetical protein